MLRMRTTEVCRECMQFVIILFGNLLLSFVDQELIRDLVS